MVRRICTVTLMRIASHRILSKSIYNSVTVSTPEINLTEVHGFIDEAHLEILACAPLFLFYIFNHCMALIPRVLCASILKMYEYRRQIYTYNRTYRHSKGKWKKKAETHWTGIIKSDEAKPQVEP